MEWPRLLEGTWNMGRVELREDASLRLLEILIDGVVWERMSMQAYAEGSDDLLKEVIKRAWLAWQAALLPEWEVH